MDGTARPVAVRRAVTRLPAGVTLPGEGALQIAVEFVAPDPLPDNAIALVCLPGGAMKRRYYDLAGDSYSFATQMAARGFICVLVDHLGIGDSDRPADGFALTADVVAQANANATAAALAQLREGTAIPGVPALPELKSVGVGHSMGAMLTIIQQAGARTHRAIAVLGFSTRGLPEYLPPAAQTMEPAALRAGIVALAKQVFVEPYPVIRRSGDTGELYAAAKAEAAGVDAIKAAREHLLPVPAMLSMLPGNVAAEAAQVDVPVFIGLGELDMAKPAHAAPGAFTGSADVTLVILKDAGHSHFLFPARHRLFERLAQWARAVI